MVPLFGTPEGQSAGTFLRRAEAGPSEGSRFWGVSFHFIVQSREAVDEVMGNAVAAGGGGVKEAAVDTSGTEAPRAAISGRSRPLHKLSQFGIKKPSLDPGLPVRPAVYLLPNSRPLRKGESHPRAKEKKFCQSFCVILLLCTARSGDVKGLNKGVPTAEAR
jgi:hypothetical protein